MYGKIIGVQWILVSIKLRIQIVTSIRIAFNFERRDIVVRIDDGTVLCHTTAQQLGEMAQHVACDGLVKFYLVLDGRRFESRFF